MKKILFSRCFILACKPQKTVIPWVPYDETEEVAKLLPMHPKMQYKVIQSKFLKMTFGKYIASQISDFRRTIIKG
jgi:hypothetical protein